MRGFKRICALAVGFVLFIAGLLKLMDPVGAGLQMDAYFKFLHLAFPFLCLLHIYKFVQQLARTL